MPSPKLQPLIEEPFFDERGVEFVYRRPLGPKGSASYVYERDKYIPHVQHYCDRNEWTELRARLVDIARANTSFIRTDFVFCHPEDVEIISQCADICLADVIETTLFTEEEASAILTKVLQLPMSTTSTLNCN